MALGRMFEVALVPVFHMTMPIMLQTFLTGFDFQLGHSLPGRLLAKMTLGLRDEVSQSVLPKVSRAVFTRNSENRRVQTESHLS